MALFVLNKSRGLSNLASINASSHPPPISALFPHMVNKNGNIVADFIPGAGTPITIQGNEPSQGKDHVFEMMRVRDVERNQQNEVNASVKTKLSTRNGYLEKYANIYQTECYQPASHVSLYGVMQTNVPHPYSNGSPTHFNMPGGNLKLDQKYLSSQLNNNHSARSGNIFAPIGGLGSQYTTINLSGVQNIYPSRHFSTSAQSFSAVQQPNTEEVIIPEYVKPEEEQAFIKWMENNAKYCLDYTLELERLSKGNITLKKLIEDQDLVLANITREYEMRVTNEGYNFEGVQGPIGPQPWLENHNVASLSSLENPCPQGVQGLNCEHFKVWLDNCTKYRFIHCDEQLKDVQEGRKNLGQIFEEQERLIKQVAEDYRAGNSPNNQVGTEPEVVVKLSQKERLKRAVAQYGSTVIVFHVGISLISLGGFYLAVSSGVDMVGLLGKLGVGQSILESRLATGTGTFVVAYAVHKVFAPVRIAMTLTCTPMIVRYLRSAGFLKPSKVVVKKAN